MPFQRANIGAESTAAVAPWKAQVKVATTGNITLSGTQTVDGIALSVGDRVLVMAQTTASQNGIYVVSSGAWTRATDLDDAADFAVGVAVMVERGTTNADKSFKLTTDLPITVGTTALAFGAFSPSSGGGGTTYTPGNGLALNNSAFSVVPKANSAIAVDANGVAVVPKASGGLAIDANGIYVLAKANAGLAIDANGVYLTVKANSGLALDASGLLYFSAKLAGGLLVDSTGVSVVPKANSGITVDSGGVGVAVKTNGGLAVDSGGLSVTPRSGGGLTVTSGGIGLDPAIRYIRAVTIAVPAGSASATLTHNLNTQDLASVLVRDTSNNLLVDVDKYATGLNTVRLDFATAPTSGQYVATISG